MNSVIDGVNERALKTWKRSIFTIVDKRFKFYSQNIFFTA